MAVVIVETGGSSKVYFISIVDGVVKIFFSSLQLVITLAPLIVCPYPKWNLPIWLIWVLCIVCLLLSCFTTLSFRFKKQNISIYNSYSLAQPD